MYQHAVPRQITTFEFKLIGFLTLKQFLYIVIFLLCGVITFFLIPISIVNFVCAGIVVLVGIAFAFVPINERPLDVWVRNFIRKLFTPTQFYYIKKNTAPDFLNDVYVGSSPVLISTHIDARKKLAAYMSQKNNNTTRQKNKVVNKNVVPLTTEVKTPDKSNLETPISKPNISMQTKHDSHQEQPFLVGYVKNSQNIPLPGILIYIKNKRGKTERILKTNTHGVFATFHLLHEGEYSFECKDTTGKYFFDTIGISIKKENPNPIIIKSKEVL